MKINVYYMLFVALLFSIQLSAFDSIAKQPNTRIINAEVKALRSKVDSCYNGYHANLLSKNFELALQYHKWYCKWSDSLAGKERIREQIQYDVKKEYEKRSLAITAEEDRRAAVAKAESRKQKTLLTLIASFSVGVVVFVIFLIKSLKRSKEKKILIERVNHETEEQKKIIEERNRELLDSIRYAERIQTSLLPTEKYIAKFLRR